MYEQLSTTTTFAERTYIGAAEPEEGREVGTGPPPMTGLGAPCTLPPNSDTSGP